MGEEKIGRKIGNRGINETGRNLCHRYRCHNFETLHKNVVTLVEGEETSKHLEVRISVPPPYFSISPFLTFGKSHIHSL